MAQLSLITFGASRAMGDMELTIQVWAKGRMREFAMRNDERAELSGWQAVYAWLDEIAPDVRITHGVVFGTRIDYHAKHGIAIAMPTGGVNDGV